MKLSRRSLITQTSKLFGVTAAAAALGRTEAFLGTASAAVAGPYRALVGVFLLGGNDANNMLIPNTTDGYASYARVRTPDDIGIAQGELRRISPVGMAADAFGLHPALAQVSGLFAARRLSFVANVGPLVGPTTIEAVRAGTAILPDNLMSHSDQQDAWSDAIPDPVAFGGKFDGWGGRLAERTASLNLPSTYPVNTFYGGHRLFAEPGDLAQSPLVVPDDGRLALGTAGVGAGFEAARRTAIDGIMAAPTTHAVMGGFGAQFGRALGNAGLRSAAVAGNPLPADLAALFPATTLGTQLLRIAEELLAGASTVGGGLGLARQVFSAGLGGFDTHDTQLARQQALYTELDGALGAFQSVLDQLNARITAGQIPGVAAPLQVTTFTMSDFGRTFQPNANGGTDHGWGSHALVMGTPVRGGRIFGTFPRLELGTGDDIGDEGRWLPSTSSDVYANTLATWFGLPAADTGYVFPKVSSFPQPTLGFMKP